MTMVAISFLESRCLLNLVGVGLISPLMGMTTHHGGRIKHAAPDTSAASNALKKTMSFSIHARNFLT